MRLRLVITAAVISLGLGLAGCGGDADKPAAQTSPGSALPSDLPSAEDLPTDPVIDIGPDCAKFAKTSQELSEASAKIYTGTPADVETAVKALRAQLDVLKDGAPDDVKDAIEDLKSAYTAIIEVRQESSVQAAQELSKLGPKLSVSSQKVAAYITEICTR